MPRGDNQQGRARPPKIKAPTDQQKSQAERSAPAPTGTPKGGIVRWPKRES